MDQEVILQFAWQILADAGSTILVDAILWGLGVAVAGVVLTIPPYMMARLVSSAPTGVWRIVSIVMSVLLAVVTVVAFGWAGFCEGGLRGTERALRESDTGKLAMESMSEVAAGMVAATYVATDPKKGLTALVPDAKTKNVDAQAIVSNEIHGFLDGKWDLELDQVGTRIEGAKDGALELAADVTRTDVNSDVTLDPKVKDASLWMLDFMVDIASSDAASELPFNPYEAFVTGLPKAAAKDGKPNKLSAVELREHTVEVILIPTVVFPVKGFVRSQQLFAGLVWFGTLFFVLIIRLVVGRLGGDDDT